MTALGFSHLWYLVGYHGDIILTINVAEKRNFSKTNKTLMFSIYKKLIILGKHMWQEKPTKHCQITGPQLLSLLFM
jgi:hypothetical protein